MMKVDNYLSLNSIVDEVCKSLKSNGNWSICGSERIVLKLT